MFLFLPIQRAWAFRELIRAILFRELSQRYNRSLVGWTWAFVSPIAQMIGYTGLFSSVVSITSSGGHQNLTDRALMIFSGITVFNLVAELLHRAPGIVIEHAGFLKKSIFPIEVLAWIALFRALVSAGIALLVLLAFQLFLTWHLPWTVILVPLVVIPIAMALMGTTWILMAIGVLTEDIIYILGMSLPFLMFMSPVFYRFADIPAPMLRLAQLNLVGDYIEFFRDVVIYGQLPDPALFAATFAASFAVFVLGYSVFRKYSAIFVDVI